MVSGVPLWRRLSGGAFCGGGTALSGICGALLPLVYAGGVMSNSIIRKHFEERYGAFFAEPKFSSDNASGVAILANRLHEKE